MRHYLRNHKRVVVGGGGVTSIIGLNETSRKTAKFLSVLHEYIY